MTNSCPLCGSPLSAARFAQVWKEHRGVQRQLDKLRAAQKRAEAEVARAKERVRDVKADARRKTERARQEERQRAEDRLSRYQKAAEKLKEKVATLEDRIRRGETAQSEGLLEERALLAFLKEHFPEDRFDHVGKGGDIIQDVCTSRGQRAGRIVFEVKKEEQWKSKNILQAAEARTKREADIAILVTNRFPKKRQNYFVEREVLVIRPEAVIPLVHTAREGLLHAHALSASGEQKQMAVRAVYDYLAGGAYSGHIVKVAQHFRDLDSLFHDEVKAHHKMWSTRVTHYRGILTGVGSVHEKLRTLILPAAKGADSKLAHASTLLPVFKGHESIKQLPQKP